MTRLIWAETASAGKADLRPTAPAQLHSRATPRASCCRLRQADVRFEPEQFEQRPTHEPFRNRFGGGTNMSSVNMSTCGFRRPVTASLWTRVLALAAAAASPLSSFAQ